MQAAPPFLGFREGAQTRAIGQDTPGMCSERKWTHSVVSGSLQPHGLQPVRLLRPWDFPGKSTGVGCHFLLQRTERQLTDNSLRKWTLCSGLNDVKKLAMWRSGDREKWNGPSVIMSLVYARDKKVSVDRECIQDGSSVSIWTGPSPWINQICTLASMM